MMTIITSLGGNSLYEMSPEFSYPKILNEVDKKTLFEYSQEIVANLPQQVRRIFLLPEHRDNQFQLSAMISVVTNGRGKVLHLQGDTGGATCSCLLAIDEIDPEDEVIIISADQYIGGDILTIIDSFRNQQADAGVLTFNSLHPKWAFIRRQADGQIIEVAEKKAISREAIAGFYYFRKGAFFTRAAQSSILKGAMVNGQYYLSGCLNEMILDNRKVTGWPLPEGSYHNFYDIHAIKEFSSFCKPGKRRLPGGFCYADIYAIKAISHPETVFDPQITLWANGVQLTGMIPVAESLVSLICPADQLLAEEHLTTEQDNKTAILYTLYSQDKAVRLLDMITTNSEGKIITIRRSEVI